MRAKASGRRSILTVATHRNYWSFYLLFALFGLCTLFYYFGELVKFAGWEALHWEFLYSVHDVHRLLFLAPILYASHVFGARASVIVAILSAAVFLPRAVFISPFPDPMVRMVAFTIIAGALGYSVAVTRAESGRRSRLEAVLRGGAEGVQAILARLEDGALIIGPDYHIRFMNSRIARDFGQAPNTFCYKLLKQRLAPCEETCRLSRVLTGSVETWECRLPNGRLYEALGAPYADSDGTVCAIVTLRATATSMEVGSTPVSPAN